MKNHYVATTHIKRYLCGHWASLSANTSGSLNSHLVHYYTESANNKYGPVLNMILTSFIIFEYTKDTKQ